jgi:transglutaminase-like putative cysteine protease
MNNLKPMDNQPMSARFFGESKWLTEFITPHNLEVESLHNELVQGVKTRENRLAELWWWVASNVRYKPFISGSLCIENNCQKQEDLWCDPSLTIKTRVGNCANKSFLLTSLARLELNKDEVYCVLGNLHDSAGIGGHAWVQVRLNGTDYIMETTRSDVAPFIPANVMDRYEAVHFFNDIETYYVPGRTVMEPYTAAFSTWLSDYLNMAYIKAGGKL